MRSMFSGAAFHRAYFRATQQAFLEAHELAFAYFGGVFQTLRYDNLKVAVKKILRGYRREETEHFIASGHTGDLPASFARRHKDTRRAASKGRSVISGGTIGCRCQRRAAWRI